MAGRVGHGEVAVAPPLRRQRLRDGDAAAGDFGVIRVDVVDFEIDLDRAGGQLAAVARPREHEAGTVALDDREVELAVLADHAHQMAEAEVIEVIAAHRIDGLDVAQRHHAGETGGIHGAAPQVPVAVAVRCGAVRCGAVSIDRHCSPFIYFPE